MSKKSIDLTIKDDNIPFLREKLMKIKDQLQSQDNLFTNLLEANQQITKKLDILEQNVDSLISRLEEDENEVPLQPEIPAYKFNLENSTITFQDQTFQYDQEYLYVHESIDNIIKHLHQNEDRINFPQGIDYVDSFLNEEKKSGNRLIIVLVRNAIQNSKAEFFYLPINNINDLSPTQGWRICNKNSFQNQINNLNKYENDNYPQSFKYCQQILRDQLKSNGCVHIIARFSNSIWTRYYFVSQMFRTLQNERLRLIKGKDKLEIENLMMNNSKKKNDYPQGIEYCKEVLKSQYDIDGEILCLAGESDDGSYLRFYIPPDQYDKVCTAEWWIKDKNKLDEEIRLIDDNDINDKFKSSYIQGKNYCKSLIQEIIENGGVVHKLVRRSVNNTCFYLKA